MQFTERDTTKVYFGGRQLPDATLVIGCLAIDGSLSGEPLELSGQTVDGRSFETAGQLFTKLVVNRGWFSNPVETIQAWMDYPSDAKIGRDDQRVYLHQHCESCSEEAFFETCALSVATLLDVVAGRYAEFTGTDNFLPQSLWQSEILPKLQTALAREPTRT